MVTTAKKTVTQSRKVKKATTKKTTAKNPTKKADAKKTDPNHEIRWSSKKLCLLKTLLKAGATNATSGITKDRIIKLSQGKALTTLNPDYDLTVQGYIQPAKVEKGKGHVFFITKKGVDFLKKDEKK